MTKRRYEVVYVLAPTLTQEEVDQYAETYSQAARENGAEVISVDKWEKRKLAFRVKKFWEGYYTILTLEEDAADAVTELERRFKVNDTVIRFLTVRIDEELKRAEKFRKEGDEEEVPEAPVEKKTETVKPAREKAESKKAEPAKPEKATAEKAEEKPAEKAEEEPRAEKAEVKAKAGKAKEEPKAEKAEAKAKAGKAKEEPKAEEAEEEPAAEKPAPKKKAAEKKEEPAAEKEVPAEAESSEKAEEKPAEKPEEE